MLWQVDVYPAVGQPNLAGARLASAAKDLGLPGPLRVEAGRGYLIEGDFQRPEMDRLARELLSDPLVERAVCAPAGDRALLDGPSHASRLIHVMLRPGVMDPVAQSALEAMADLGLKATGLRTLRKYWIEPLDDAGQEKLCAKVLANPSIEQVVAGPLDIQQLALGSYYRFQRMTVPLRGMSEPELADLSRRGQLYLKPAEMLAIQQHFRGLERDPTDVELETIAQTWSEHCSHKTLAGRIEYRDEQGSQRFENMLRETIFEATRRIRADLGAADWCVSVFQDNAGVVQFDEQHHVVFKVETHNHPSALEPYGGANTGVGGVIRDPLGTGLGARPVCNTDVFCFAPPDTPASEIPPGVLHPKRIMQGVVAGVRDYGNRMGIPTINGAIYFDPRYLGNPLVYCGTVGMLPRDKVHKQPQAGDLIVAVGGRTGRDGIHGATFSSAELTSDSEKLSGGAVQIGNAITEKMLLDVVLVARDRGLFHAITDCGAGGFSSAVGEMGEHLGAEVWLDRVPLKYEGLSYTEIWISEAQERMVLAVPPGNWDEFRELCASEGVEASAIGKFVPTGRLKLLYQAEQVGDLAMDFLHGGRPKVVRQARYQPPAPREFSWPAKQPADFSRPLLAILGSLNVASKEWVIRQYDHEVQGGSVVKPLVGIANDGPSDASVIRPVLGSRRGVVVACGMNPHFGDLDPYRMAASAIDEAVRNCVAVGADPKRIAILDNFCWGDTDRPETLGSLVRAALACRDVAIALGTPFISGKDSLNNEFKYQDLAGQSISIAIPSSLLISALGQVEDVEQCVTMDLKAAGNLLYLVGVTRDEMGASHLALVESLSGGVAPAVDAELARRTFQALHATIRGGLVRACHDLSEGGLAVAMAEMCFAGGLGARLELQSAHATTAARGFDAQHAGANTIWLFSESNTRFLCEVRPAQASAFEAALAEVVVSKIGEVTNDDRLRILGISSGASPGGVVPPPIVDAKLADLKEAWQRPLRW